MTRYRVSLSFRPRGTRQWLTARWPQTADGYGACRSLVLALVAANDCEYGWLHITEAA